MAECLAVYFIVFFSSSQNRAFRTVLTNCLQCQREQKMPLKKDKKGTKGDQFVWKMCCVLMLNISLARLSGFANIVASISL